MDRMPKAPASPVLVSAPVDGLGVPLNLEARAARLLDEGQAVVLLTVVEREGSAPRAAGTRALLTAAGLEGTVGGGLLEARAVEAANVCLKEGRSARVRCDLTGLGPDSDMICGGSMDLLCEYLTPAQAPLFRAADAALKAGLTGIWLLDVSRADAPERDLYLDALPEGQPLVAGLHEGAEAGLVRDGLVERYVEALDAPPVLLLCGGGGLVADNGGGALQPGRNRHPDASGRGQLHCGWVLLRAGCGGGLRDDQRLLQSVSAGGGRIESLYPSGVRA